MVVRGRPVTSEGKDRRASSLPGNQDALIAAVRRPTRTPSWCSTPAVPVTMPWLERVHTLVEAWYPGEEHGNALGRGAVRRRRPLRPAAGDVPGQRRPSPDDGPPRYPAGPDGYDYSEGLNVGYRGYDAHALSVAVPVRLRRVVHALRVLRTVVRRPAPQIRSLHGHEHREPRTGADPQVYIRFPQASASLRSNSRPSPGRAPAA